jgi:hypothetical protein
MYSYLALSSRLLTNTMRNPTEIGFLKGVYIPMKFSYMLGGTSFCLYVAQLPWRAWTKQSMDTVFRLGNFGLLWAWKLIDMQKNGN